ncbi:hypothetical protein BO94DRAFT_528209 [Aspergillus sclerotioniger CBS 115572]|uniref:2EXR domain-containing protein n=1 Tax=Aspergillus sclerotioniger CBS 115572 TaxID=1450535 RepID=A0A317V0M4_9EURO|nr:hypothetical protein BO94DRAFT_528209 [Aspergillus sclerotioniger CBS 115572]PWY67219.1 hypothetical protein BO94DRAFT_528209 [Aspergillus sclerotioniger CBS 115572]
MDTTPHSRRGRWRIRSRRPPKPSPSPPPPPPAPLTPSLPALPQTTSPLFTHLPPELRNKIYAYTLESAPASDPTTRAYRRQALYYRPGFQSPKRISTALLQTCQQIYSEASLLPPSLTAHTFWCYRAPPHVRNPASPQEYFSRMTAMQRGAVREVAFFTQQFYLEGSWGRALNSLDVPVNKGVFPKKLTLTLRHSDWWFWESDEMLGIDPFQRGRFVYVPWLEELVVEFETVMRKRDQLDAIVKMARGWKFPLGGDGEGEWEGSGSEDEGGRVGRVPKLVPLRDDSGKGKGDGKEDLDYDPTVEEEYYVVFMTWKRQKVE